MRRTEFPLEFGEPDRSSLDQALARVECGPERASTPLTEAGTELAPDLADITESPGSAPLPMVRITTESRVHVLPIATGLPKVLAEFSTEPAPGEPVEGRWTRLRITQIAASRYLCEKTRGPEPLEERSATVGNLESAKAFFGGGWVVKELFAILDPVRFPRWP